MKGYFMKRIALIAAFVMFAALAAGSLTAQETPKPSRVFNEVPFTDVHFSDGFWAPRIETNRTVSAAHNIDWCENQTGRIDNFLIAGGKKQGKFKGIYFDDSDVYKVIEGLAYTLAAKDDATIHDAGRRWIDAIASAQREDGYLMCYFTLVKPDEKWTNLANMHELYCAGHMAEAAVTWKRATGDDSLLNVNRRLMDLICSRYGDGEGQLKNVAGHEEIELALVKLYQLTGDEKYLKQAKFFVDCRGVAEGREKGLFGEYCQDHKPLREQSEIVGHAVRAMYCFSGATDVAGYYHDDALMAAMNRLWNNVTLRKMYIIGGIGSDAKNEGFRDEFFLPNKSAYCETCAAIGLVLWAHRMNLATGDAKFVDVMEQALYNNVLSGYAISGDKYFYVNPLASDGHHHRQPFFDCACCPTNVIRLIASLPGYVYTTERSAERKAAGLDGDDTIVVNLFVEGKATVELADKFVEIVQATNYPFDGKVTVTTETRLKEGVDPSAAAPLFIKTRIPEWLGEKAGITPENKGYALHSCEGAKSVVELDFEMPVVRMVANPQIAADRGLTALKRGPLVYCFEQCDNDAAVDRIVLPKESEFKTEFREQFISTPDDAEVARDSKARDVAVVTCQDWEGKTLTAVPYCVWDNRAAGKMAVWVRQLGLSARPDASPEALEKNGWTNGGEPVPYRPLKDADLTESEIDPSYYLPRFSASFAADAQSSFIGDNPEAAPRDSSDQNVPRFTFWDHKGTAEWFQYDFVKPRTLSKSTLYWFDDEKLGGGCRVPDSWRLLYQPAGSEEWLPVEADGALAFSTEKNRDITVRFKPVAAARLRAEVKLRDGFSGGILKWAVE